MSQNFNTPAAADSLADARSKTELSLKALDSDHSGASAPSSPVAFRRWVDSVNNWLWRRNPANTAWVADRPVDGAGGVVIHLAKWVTYANQGADVTVGYLPANHVVESCKALVTTLFDGSGTDYLDVGFSGTAEAYMADGDLSSTGTKTGAGAQLGTYQSAARTILARYTATSPTQGKALVMLTARIVPAQP